MSATVSIGHHASPHDTGRAAELDALAASIPRQVEAARRYGAMVANEEFPAGFAREVYDAIIAAAGKLRPDASAWDISVIIGGAANNEVIRITHERLARDTASALPPSADLAQAERWAADVMAVVHERSLEAIPVPADVRSFVARVAQVLGVLAGCGDISLDEAYKAAKEWCVSAQRRTAGRVTVASLFPGCTASIDAVTTRIAEQCGRADDAAFRALREVGLRALARNLPAASVGDSIREAAMALQPNPPPEVLFDAYEAAVREARRNARWMTMRGAV